MKELCIDRAVCFVVTGTYFSGIASGGMPGEKECSIDADWILS